MTTEIAILNRRALVLAADSAGTVTSWGDGKSETRYFKGENKVFQLVTERPIGLMTFGNAHIMHAPWDVVIKEFRRTIGVIKLPSVQEYADLFFAQLEVNHFIFSSIQREDDFRSKVSQQIFRLATRAFRDCKAAQASGPDARKAAFQAQVVKLSSELDGREPHPQFTREDINKALADLGNEAELACNLIFSGPIWLF